MRAPVLALAARCGLAVLVMAAVSACAEGFGARRTPVTAPDAVALRLAEAAEQAARALDQLARVEQLRTPAALVAPVVETTEDLRRPVTVSWIGPIEPVARRLAERAGYAFVVSGREPPVPVLVDIAAEEVPILEVLRDLGLQAGERATVIVDMPGRRIEVRHEPGLP